MSLEKYRINKLVCCEVTTWHNVPVYGDETSLSKNKILTKLKRQKLKEYEALRNMPEYTELTGNVDYKYSEHSRAFALLLFKILKLSIRLFQWPRKLYKWKVHYILLPFISLYKFCSKTFCLS